MKVHFAQAEAEPAKEAPKAAGAKKAAPAGPIN
jgi:hypothetical protein